MPVCFTHSKEERFLVNRQNRGMASSLARHRSCRFGFGTAADSNSAME